MPWTAKTHRHATAPGTVPVPLAGDDHAVQMVPAAPAILTTTDLKARIGTASLAFRGYDVQNLGRTPELLAHPVYGPTVRRYLDLASAVAADALHRPFDLAARVERREETTLAAFAEDVALIVSMELAQLALLDEFFGVSAKGAQQTFGYSIGELASVVCGGLFTMEELLPIPLACADDCADLAVGTTLGVVFCAGRRCP